MDISGMRRAERYAKSMGDGPRPRGIGDNNRGSESPQVDNKVFQSAEEICNNPGTKITGVIHDSGRGVPFNIDESGERYGSHY